MKAKCINDKSEEYPNFKGKSSQNKVSGLTKDKSYEVEQSKQYDDYFEVINDLGVKESYKKERFEVMEDKKVQERFNVKCVDNYYDGNKLSLTVEKEYEVVAESSKSYSLKNDNGIIQPYDKKHFKKVKVNKDHTPNYAEEQLENAIQKRITCYQKECSGNRENKCTVKDRICVSRLEKPINYEEEYKKLKEEHENLLKEKKWSPSIFAQFNNLKYENSQYARINKELVLQRDKIKEEKEKILSNRDKAIAKFEEEIERLKKEIEEGYQCIETKCENKLFLAEQKANETINSLMSVNDKYMEKQKKMESDLIKYEDTIKTLKGIIKNISEVL